MPKISRHRNYRKTYRTPSRAFEKERLDQELRLVGEYGLRCKREIWRVQFALSKIRKAARELLTLDAKDPKRLFEGQALIRRLRRYGLLPEDEIELDFVLQVSRFHGEISLIYLTNFYSLTSKSFLNVVCKPRFSNKVLRNPSIMLVS